MSYDTFEPGEIRKFQEVIFDEYKFGQVNLHDSNVVELYPTSFSEESERFHTEITKRYRYLQDREVLRRVAFLEEWEFIGYQNIEKNDSDVVAEINSETAWERKYEFPDGSTLGEFEIAFIDEDIDVSTDILQTETSYTQEEIEEYQRDLREKYEIERAKYRLELEELADLGGIKEDEAIDLVIETAELEINESVADELRRIFEDHDIFDPIRKSEIARIKREEKKEKFEAIISFLTKGLEED